MVVNDIKPLVNGIAQLQYIMAGGIAVYHIISVDDKKYQLVKHVPRNTICRRCDVAEEE